jgi:phosphoenolpyruvate carboxykinase (ATP)
LFVAGECEVIDMLTADAFGVLPPISLLTPAQAMYHFPSGYTAKVAGTEKGVTEPQATFSACFGAAFMSLSPAVYARLLGEKIAAHQVSVWLLNTGWSGGPYGTGHRMAIDYTRAMVHAALAGALDQVPTQPDPIFPTEVLDPRRTWSDPRAYDAQAHLLAGLFAANLRNFGDAIPDDVRAAGPRVG